MDNQEVPLSQTLADRLLSDERAYSLVVSLFQEYIKEVRNEMCALKLLDISAIAEYNQLQGELRAYESIVDLAKPKQGDYNA